MKKKKPRNRSEYGGLVRRILPQRLGVFSLTIGEGALELMTNLLAMVLVERAYSQAGLGIYSYLLSFFLIGGYAAEFGVPRYVERETALHHDNAQKQAEVLADGYRAVFWLGFLFAGFCFLSAAYDTSHTRVQENMVAYLIIGFTVPIRSLNQLMLAAMHGHGRHEEVAGLQGKKRLVFLGAIFFLSRFHPPPSYLVLCFLATEMSMMAMAARKISLPSLKTPWRGRHRFRPTLREGYRVLFAADALDIILYVDLLILGFYVPAWELGVYAEASILARCFLLVPMSIGSIFRRKYCVLVAEDKQRQAANMVHKAGAALFYLHSLLALYALLHYPEILHFFFITHGEELLSLRIFIVLIPGLLFSASVIASESIYEAEGQILPLRKIVLSVSLINIALNIYLVPFAGFFGAATATMISMMLYFFLFGIQLPEMYRVAKSTYLLAGGVVHLVYVLMQELDAGLFINILLLPVLVYLLFSFIGFFSFQDGALFEIGQTEQRRWV